MRSTSLVLVMTLALAVTACGGGSADSPQSSETRPADDGASVDLGGGGSVDLAAIQAEADALAALPAEEFQARLAPIGLDVQVALGEVSGLTEAVGGPDELRDALIASAAPLIADASALGEPDMVFGFRAAPAGPTVGEGLFGAYLVNALGALGVVRSTNGLKDGESGRSDTGATGGEISVEGDLTSARLTVDGTTTDSKTGVTTSMKVKTVVTPCPDANGQFEATTTAEVAARKGDVGQTATLDVTLRGQLDDNAELASSETDFRMQFAKFGGGRGGFLDVSVTPGKTLTVNRTGGTLTQEIVDTAVQGGSLYALLMGMALQKAAEEGWKSGRCVRLDVSASAGPSGLAPSEQLTLTAAPKSRVDGAPAGGTVTATLTSGGASVAPSGSPVKADATFDYTAPGERDQTGTVSFESRSRRGVGKGEITLDTKAAGYTAEGGGNGGVTTGTIADIDAPFTLLSEWPGGTGTYSFSGGMSGTVTMTGGGNGATANADGTYSIVDNGDGTLTMSITQTWCLSGVPLASGCAPDSEVITLTPAG